MLVSIIFDLSWLISCAYRILKAVNRVVFVWFVELFDYSMKYNAFELVFFYLDVCRIENVSCAFGNVSIHRSKNLVRTSSTRAFVAFNVRVNSKTKDCVYWSINVVF